MTKKTLLATLALAVMLVGFVPASHAGQLNFWVSFNSGTTWSALTSCAAGNVCTGTNTSGGITFTILAGTANFPGGTGAETDTANVSITNTNAGTSAFWLAETAAGFTSPTGTPLYLSASQGGSTPAQTGNVSFTSSGTFANNFTTGSPGTWGPGTCSAITGPVSIVSSPTSTQSGSSNSSSVPCANTGAPFGLLSVSAISLDKNDQLNINTSVSVNSVPEPASMLLFGSGLVGLAGVLRRKLSR